MHPIKLRVAPPLWTGANGRLCLQSNWLGSRKGQPSHTCLFAGSGANGLAAPRDFQTPVARYEDRESCFTVLHKLCGQVFKAQQSYSPFDVVAWHGNYAPYKYDLARYCPVNTVRSHCRSS